MQYHDSTFCTFLSYFTTRDKSRIQGERWKPAISVLQRRTVCWHVWITIVSAYKVIFYKDRKTTPAALTFSDTARILQNLACSECDPKFHVFHWFYNWLHSQGQYLETCKTSFFQLICLPRQLLLTNSNFPIDDDSTVNNGSTIAIIHFHPVGCNPKLSYTSFFPYTKWLLGRRSPDFHYCECTELWVKMLQGDSNTFGVKRRALPLLTAFPSAQQKFIWRHVFHSQLNTSNTLVFHSLLFPGIYLLVNIQLRIQSPLKSKRVRPLTVRW